MSDYFDRVEHQIVRRVQEGAPRSSRLRALSGHMATAAAVVVVIVVVGVFLFARGGAPTSSPAGGSRLDVALTGSPSDPQAVAQTVYLLRARLTRVLPDARVSSAGGGIVVRVPNASPAAKAQILALAAPGKLELYDWEANAIGPSGKKVASRLTAQDPSAFEISQGIGNTSPGGLGAGSMSLRQALALAARLGAHAPRRTEHVDGLTLHVPVGFVLLEATGSVSSDAGFYLLRDYPAMSNSAIVNPQPKANRGTGTPGVSFGFNAAGQRAFQSLTATVARRGALVSGLGQTLNQHFAIALDNTLISVPSIDYKQYPDGIAGDRGADVSADFTTQSARNLALLLRYGPLPVNLTVTG